MIYNVLKLWGIMSIKGHNKFSSSVYLRKIRFSTLFKAGFSSFTEPDGLTHETFQRGPRPELCKLEEYWIGLDYIHEGMVVNI